MPAYHFDADYCEVASLRDGQLVHVRLVRPSDKDMLREAFAHMSPEARYRRFFVPKTRLSARELRYLTEVDQIDHVAIGAERITADGTIEGLGVARFVRLRDEPDTAEAAVTVIDAFQGKGLGSLLLQRLIAAARERGIRRLRCEILGSNQPMQELVRSSGSTRARFDGPVCTMDLDLPDLSPVNPADQPPRHDAIYELFSLVARGLVTVQERDRERAEKGPAADAE